MVVCGYMRKTPLATGHVYHIFNRGVNKQAIFFDKSDYTRFLKAAIHYKSKSTKFGYELENERVSIVDDTGSSGELALQPKVPKVEVLAYCLMPNHFHFLIKQLEDEGITGFMRRLMNSYAHYINVKRKRVGPLFAGRFKNVLIETDEQFLHVSRYIHLNPLVSGLVDSLEGYPWSSYACYVNGADDKLCSPDGVVKMFESATEYKKFVLDQADYGRELERIKHLVLDVETG